jgi:hypothetical protein
MGTWWSGRLARKSQWSFFQAFIGLNIFFILSYTFESTVLDMYSPDASTMLSSAATGIVTMICLVSTHLVRTSPHRMAGSLTYQLALLVINPSFMIYGQRAPLGVLAMVVVSLLLCAASWRRPSRRKGHDEVVSRHEMEEMGLKRNEEGDVTKGSLTTSEWETERACLVLIALGFFSSLLHLISEPLLLVLSTLVLFVWLNAPVLLPSGIFVTFSIAFLGRLFHVVSAYNLDYLTNSLFVRDRIGVMASILDWTFWSPALASAGVMGALVLGKEGIPMEPVEKFLDSDLRWIWIWRSVVVAFFIILFRSLYYWVFHLIPLLRAVS